MKKKNILLGLTLSTVLMTGCIEEFTPQNSTVSKDQVIDAPNSYENFVNSLTSTLAGDFVYIPNEQRVYDFGYSSLYLVRDVMGQDLVYPVQVHYNAWYTCSYLGPSYAYPQLSWSYYYGWIKSCNTVIDLAGENPDDKKRSGAGLAHALRAMYYMDLAQMYATKTYGVDKNAETVPIVTEKTTFDELTKNPRATNENMFKFIIEDLNKAEDFLDGFNRKNVYVPDQSVVYGLKARAYLLMQDWANAQTYAKKAQAGYSIMTEEEYTSHELGFNTPNNSWMFGITFKSDSPNILLNDGDSSWGSMMCLEINPNVSGCGYAANYGQPFLIDRHLYETIPATDFRKKCFVDFEIDKLEKPEAIEKLKDYSDHPDWIYNSGKNIQGYQTVGGLPLKFRTAGGEVGRNDQYIGFVVAVPVMRVEEMYLIEAEAAGMQNEAEGINLLTAFAQKRDASYRYGTHNEAYGSASIATPFQNEIWWQRRVELWGEGMATHDIKRLNKGIIRSYPNSNHADTYRWNTTDIPEWMNFCMPQTETNYNSQCKNNPTPIAPTGNSPEHIW